MQPLEMRQLTRHKCRVYHTRQVKRGGTPLADRLQQIQVPGDIATVFGRILFPIGESERLTRLFSQLASQAEIELLRDTLVYLMDWTCLFETEDEERGGYMEACQALVRHQKAWIRQVVEFRPKPGPPTRQFAALTRYLFLVDQDRGKGGIPAFMDSAWFSSDARGQQYQQVFIDIGTGTDLRKSGFPFSVMTQRMVREFMAGAPSVVFTPEQAIRWAEIQVLGRHRPRSVNKVLLEAILQTRLGSHFRDEVFWRNVLRFLIRHDIAPQIVPQVIDYIWYRRYEAADPRFSLKGRTAASLLRLTESWHREVHEHITLPERSWAHVPDISDTTIQDGSKCYIIRQLLSTEEIGEEGSVLNHCVRSYGTDCYDNKTSIWSMAEEQKGKVLTIEVSLPDRIIRQVRGFANRDATNAELAVIRKWAAAERLHFRIPR